MANFNRVILIGNLTKDPDFKPQPSGQGLCKLSLASNRQFRNKQTGAMVQEVCYIDVTVWGPQADNCRQYLQKGRPVLVEGRLKLDSWKDAEGQQRQRHTIVAENVVFLGARGEADGKAREEGTGDEVMEALFKDEAPFADDLPF
ncbi:single-stranded DNA-binding protein [Candidatus Dependentiae bacterium]|nr:single-stranded DNA-binding protein [Candidatus Dependentiae bacterium]